MHLRLVTTLEQYVDESCVGCRRLLETHKSSIGHVSHCFRLMSSLTIVMQPKPVKILSREHNSAEWAASSVLQSVRA